MSEYSYIGSFRVFMWDHGRRVVRRSDSQIQVEASGYLTQAGMNRRHLFQYLDVFPGSGGRDPRETASINPPARPKLPRTI